jgi:hypothetical protein
VLQAVLTEDHQRVLGAQAPVQQAPGRCCGPSSSASA